jgi:peptidyl-prolyl cis-trans isomerase A (cyclophilin A)
MRRATLLLPAFWLLTGCNLLDQATKKDAPAPSATASATTSAKPAPPPPPKPAPHPASDRPLFHPERATEHAPEHFRVRFVTTKGDFVVAVTRAWAPLGADRFYNLVKLGYYDGARFYRAIDGFMVQFGIHGDPAVTAAWHRATIPDDKVIKSNTRGFVTFAMAGANSRTTQLFINYADQNRRLDSMGFAPFGQVLEGMNVVDSLYKGYGETRPKGNGPDAARADREGEPYFAREFPSLDRIKSARLQ